MALPKRKELRLQSYDYSQTGVYFITICTRDKNRILSEVRNGKRVLLPFGLISEKYIKEIGNYYDNVRFDNYVIMPNHIHALISISGGSSGTPTSTVSQIVSTFKRFCNKDFGENIWQRSFFDHVIRNDEDYLRHMQYINENPKKWENDEYF
ncbi:MAG: transposase [Clostridia bacterium]|nr:transposase [Clostridia bacterium]